MSIVAICSDSHDNLTNISKFLHYCNKNKIKTIIHCGDWCYPSTLDFFRKNFSGKIHGVFGNVHSEEDEMLKTAEKYNINLTKNVNTLNIENLKIAFCHFPKTAEKLAQTNKYTIVFHGHTHKPELKDIGKTTIINPGTLSGMFSKATFAIYDFKNKKLELKILNN